MNVHASMPVDVRLMNLATALLLSVFGVAALGSLATWMLRHPAFALEAITVQGEVSRNNVVSLRSHVMPQLQGNFFTMDLAHAQQAFETVPWVRAAVVHRDFPNRLRTVLLEHHPIAMWGEEGASTMVNEQGQVFEANVEDSDAERLPRMKGPEGQSMAVASMYRELAPRMESMDMAIDQLELTSRGGWRMSTVSGAQIELGRGSPPELMQKLNVFFGTLAQVTARYGRTPTALAGADLRHRDGYALRLHGVSSVEANNTKKP